LAGPPWHETRRVEVASIIRQPHGAWMLQVAKNLLDTDDGFLSGKRYLVMFRKSNVLILH
jgi:putative transposase